MSCSELYSGSGTKLRQMTVPVNVCWDWADMGGVSECKTLILEIPHRDRSQSL